MNLGAAPAQVIDLEITQTDGRVAYADVALWVGDELFKAWAKWTRAERSGAPDLLEVDVEDLPRDIRNEIADECREAADYQRDINRGMN